MPPQPVSGGTSCETSSTLMWGGKRSLRGYVLAVPGERAPQTVLEPHRRLPRGQLLQLGVVDPLAVDLSGWGTRATHVRRDPAAGELTDHPDDIEHPVWFAAACVERLPGGRSGPIPGAEGARDGQVGRDRIFDIEEIPLRRAIRAHDRGAA